MILFKKAESLTNYLRSKRNPGLLTGFVPTMGAIHEGHISLVVKAKETCQLVVASIFINPTQFNNPDDFAKYPVSLEKDIDMLEQAGCDILFLPSVQEIYPAGYQPEYYELGTLETVFEGAFRPGHFQGVCQVVDRLLQITRPDKMFIGQKDFQQCMVLKKLVELKAFPTEVVICPTLREAGGLAMSSRNRRLAETEKEAALEISRQLQWIKKNIKEGPFNELIAKSKNALTSKGFQVDYLSVARMDTLQEVQAWDGRQQLVALVAATINQVRLIDNLILND